jgi:hypothetical protein
MYLFGLHANQNALGRRYKQQLTLARNHISLITFAAAIVSGNTNKRETFQMCL